MPAAEIAGLAIGAIALALLFTTCVELFDLFEVGKNCIYDYDLACTKISLLRERLRAWGNTLRVTEPGAEDFTLREQWPTEREIVAASLTGQRRKLYDSEALKQKYHLSVSSIGFRRRTVWAIRDRAKVEKLIQDISFLVDGLEKITAEHSSAVQKYDQNAILYRRESLSDRLPTFKQRANAKNTTTAATLAIEEGESDAATPNIDSEEQPRAMPAPITIDDVEYVISGTQYNRQCSIGVQGIIGQSHGMFCVKGIQINCDSAIGIQGCASMEAVGYLQRSSHCS